MKNMSKDAYALKHQGATEKKIQHEGLFMLIFPPTA